MQQEQQQQMSQLQSSAPLQNYVYISTVQDVNSKQFGNEITSYVAAQPIQSNATTVTYSLNSMGILEGLTNNGYSIQQLNVPTTAVQYQPIAGERFFLCFFFKTIHPQRLSVKGKEKKCKFSQLVVSSIPLQPFVSNRLVTTNESTIKNDDRPIEDTNLQQQNGSQARTNGKADGVGKTCTTCGKNFPTSIKLSRHMKTHSQMFTHRCKICHKGEKTLAWCVVEIIFLNQNLSILVKGFTHGGNFKVHMRMHNDERV